MMKNQLAGLMKQAQTMQDNMKKAQEQLALVEVEGQSGAGLVKIVMTCKNDVKRVSIDPSQLAVQAELIECLHDGHSTTFRLRVPIDTWRSPATVEKLAAALTERFGRKVAVDTELGAVWYTASAEAQAYREACQLQAEATIASDPFVLDMKRAFDAFVVPGTITPAPAGSAAPTLH